RRRARDAPAFGMRLLDDEVRLAPGLLLHVLGGALRGDERRAEKRLELAVLRGLEFELLELVREIGPLPPDLLEAVCDLGQESIDPGSLVAAEPRSAKLHVSDLYWGKRHATSFELQERPDHAIHNDRRKD